MTNLIIMDGIDNSPAKLGSLPDFIDNSGLRLRYQFAKQMSSEVPSAVSTHNNSPAKLDSLPDFCRGFPVLR